MLAEIDREMRIESDKKRKTRKTRRTETSMIIISNRCMADTLHHSVVNQRDTHLLLGSVQILLVLIRSEVSRIRIILHQLIDMSSSLIKDISTFRIGSHVCSADVVRLGVNVYGAVGICSR